MKSVHCLNLALSTAELLLCNRVGFSQSRVLYQQIELRSPIAPSPFHATTISCPKVTDWGDAVYFMAIKDYQFPCQPSWQFRVIFKAIFFCLCAPNFRSELGEYEREGPSCGGSFQFLAVLIRTLMRLLN